MKRKFVKTKNVRRFITLMENLINTPPNVSKMALVHGEYSAGKTQAILWWASKNDAIYVRACQGMTSRWLLSKIAEEMDESPYWHTQLTFELIEQSLKLNPRTVIVDEVEHLIEKKAFETLRDLHDRANIPVILVGMSGVERQLARYKYLYDRFYDVLKFEPFNSSDIREIIEQLCDIEFTEDAINYLSTRTNLLRQVMKLLDKIEKKSKINAIKILDENQLRGLLNEKQDIKTLPEAKQLYA